jgi:hypothetical protein
MDGFLGNIFEYAGNKSVAYKNSKPKNFCWKNNVQFDA